MRDTSINKETVFSQIVLESIRLEKPAKFLDLLPWTKTKIETKDYSITWTERDVFNSSAPFAPAVPMLFQNDDTSAERSSGDVHITHMRGTNSENQRTQHLKDDGYTPSSLEQDRIPAVSTFSVPEKPADVAATYAIPKDDYPKHSAIQVQGTAACCTIS
jgi:hypothetical protein